MDTFFCPIVVWIRGVPLYIKSTVLAPIPNLFNALFPQQVSSPFPGNLILPQSTTVDRHKSPPHPPPPQNHPSKPPLFRPLTPALDQSQRAIESLPLPPPPLAHNPAVVSLVREICEFPPVAQPDLSVRSSHTPAPPETRPLPLNRPLAQLTGKMPRKKRGGDIARQNLARVELRLPFVLKATPPWRTGRS